MSHSSQNRNDPSERFVYKSSSAISERTHLEPLPLSIWSPPQHTHGSSYELLASPGTMIRWRLDLWAVAACFAAVTGLATPVPQQHVLSSPRLPTVANGHELDAGNATMAALLDQCAPVFKLS